ncbi:MAG: hypothetical protein ACXWUZ_17030 [Allosphingosinicella sp.]
MSATPDDAPLSFGYSGRLAPMMWAFVALASLELFVVHFLVSIWSVTAAVVLSVLTTASIAWLVLLIRSFRRLPVIVEHETLLFRSGTLMTMRVKLADIVRVRGHFPGEALKLPSVLNFAMLSYPNILVELREPVRRGRRQVISLAHCLDEPEAFVRALGPRLVGAG